MTLSITVSSSPRWRLQKECLVQTKVQINIKYVKVNGKFTAFIQLLSSLHYNTRQHSPIHTHFHPLMAAFTHSPTHSSTFFAPVDYISDFLIIKWIILGFGLTDIRHLKMSSQTLGNYNIFHLSLIKQFMDQIMNQLNGRLINHENNPWLQLQPQ